MRQSVNTDPPQIICVCPRPLGFAAVGFPHQECPHPPISHPVKSFSSSESQLNFHLLQKSFSEFSPFSTNHSFLSPVRFWREGRPCPTCAYQVLSDDAVRGTVGPEFKPGCPILELQDLRDKLPKPQFSHL